MPAAVTARVRRMMYTPMMMWMMTKMQPNTRQGHRKRKRGTRFLARLCRTEMHRRARQIPDEARPIVPPIVPHVYRGRPRRGSGKYNGASGPWPDECSRTFWSSISVPIFLAFCRYIYIERTSDQWHRQRLNRPCCLTLRPGTRRRCTTRNWIFMGNTWLRAQATVSSRYSGSRYVFVYDDWSQIGIWGLCVAPWSGETSRSSSFVSLFNRSGSDGRLVWILCV